MKAIFTVLSDTENNLSNVIEIYNKVAVETVVSVFHAKENEQRTAIVCESASFEQLINFAYYLGASKVISVCNCVI